MSTPQQSSPSDWDAGRVLLNADEVRQKLPQRYPFLLLDKVIVLDFEKQEIVAVRAVSANEPYFPGHFPTNSIMPGVLQLEAMAQASGLYTREAHKDREAYSLFFVTIDKAKFRKPVVPGDLMFVQAVLERARGRIFAFNCRAYVNTALVSEARLTVGLNRNS